MFPTEDKAALRWLDARDSDLDGIWGDQGLFEREPVTLSIQVPDGVWQLGMEPSREWAAAKARLGWYRFAGHLVAVLVAGLLLLVLLERRHIALLAWTDQLTGLPNRRMFQHRLERLLQESRRRRHTSDTFLGYAMYVAPLVTGGGALAIGYGLASGSVYGYQTGGRLGPGYRGGAGMALTAIETATRFYSPSINYAITFHDGYQTGGIVGGATDVAISFVKRKAMQQAYRQAAGFKHQWETRDALAAAGNQAWRDNLRLQNHRQEKAYGKALVQHHQDAYNTYRAASRAGAPRPQLATLDAQLMDLTAAVKHSPYAKAYLKFEASPQVQARYNATDRLHTQRIVREFRAELSRSGFDIEQLSMRPIRNAGNVTPGMDLDLNVVSRDGRVVRYRDPVTGVERNMDLYSANKLWQDTFSKVYARNSGSRSARQSWQMVTSDAHLEAYHTEGGAMSPWIRICSIRGRGDVLGASRSALDLIDPRYASDAGRITEFKAHEMRHMRGMGRDLQNMEIFRGTAKDIRTKIQPLLVDRLRQPLTQQQRAKTIATQNYYNRLLKAMDMAYDDPVAAEREVRLITGRHPVESVHMVTLGIESLGLFH